MFVVLVPYHVENGCKNDYDVRPMYWGKNQINIYDVASIFDKFYDESLEPGGPDDFITEADIFTACKASLTDGLVDNAGVIGKGGQWTMISNHKELQWKDGGLYGIKFKLKRNLPPSSPANPSVFSFFRRLWPFSNGYRFARL